MANLYNNWVVTKKYATTETAALTSGNKIEYVRIITSDDKFAQSDLKNFTDLILTTIKVRQSLPVSSVTVKDNVVTVTAIATSTGNTQDYDVNTALMICRYNGIEFLAAAVTAITPQRVPAEGEQEKTEFTIRPQFTLSNADTVSTVVDPVTAATNERVDNEVMNLQSQIDAANRDRKSIWDKITNLVDTLENQTINGVKTFTQKIVGSITGNAGSATKLETSRKIDGKEFDGTQDIVLDVVHKTGDEVIGGNKTFNGNLKVTGTFSQSTVSTPVKIPYCTSDKATLVRVGNLVFFQGTFIATSTHAAGPIYNPGEYPTETIPSGFRPNTLREDIRISKRSASGGEFVGRITLQTDGKMTDMRLYNSAFANTVDAMVISGGGVWATDDPYPSN